ncbi:MAG: hypothetical protein JSR58_04850 [Verrucomicrobia bacterium]|nr:hypothetical protein [Verrucomicrobiota bacterium]
MRFLFFLLLLCASCSPESSDDFRHEGEAIARALVDELQEVENRQDLLKASPKLKKLFEQLVDLMIAARNAQMEPQLDSTEMSQVLQAELKRIYRMEGGREVIEKAQKEALLRLDAFERSLK